MTEDQVADLITAINATTQQVAEVDRWCAQLYVACLAAAIAAGLSAGLLAAQIVTRSLTLKRWWT